MELLNSEICFIYQEPVKAPEQTTPRKMTLSLFDQDEEDEGDLFAATSSSSTPSSATKQKETKPAEQDTVSYIHQFISCSIIYLPQGADEDLQGLAMFVNKHHYYCEAYRDNNKAFSRSVTGQPSTFQPVLEDEGGLCMMRSKCTSLNMLKGEGARGPYMVIGGVLRPGEWGSQVNKF